MIASRTTCFLFVFFFFVFSLRYIQTNGYSLTDRHKVLTQSDQTHFWQYIKVAGAEEKHKNEAYVGCIFDGQVVKVMMRSKQGRCPTKKNNKTEYTAVKQGFQFTLDLTS